MRPRRLPPSSPTPRTAAPPAAPTAQSTTGQAASAAQTPQPMRRDVAAQASVHSSAHHQGQLRARAARRMHSSEHRHSSVRLGHQRMHSTRYPPLHPNKRYYRRRTKCRVRRTPPPQYVCYRQFRVLIRSFEPLRRALYRRGAGRGGPLWRGARGRAARSCRQGLALCAAATAFSMALSGIAPTFSRRPASSFNNGGSRAARNALKEFAPNTLSRGPRQHLIRCRPQHIVVHHRPPPSPP